MGDDDDGLMGPIVVLVNLSDEDEKRLGLSEEHIREAYGSALEVANIRLLDQVWWLDPLDPMYLHTMLDIYPERGIRSARVWIESDRFVTEIQRFLAGQIDASIGLDGLPEGWEKLVTLVVFDGSLRVENSAYARRVFDGWFPNAKYRVDDGAKVWALWREAEVTPIENGAVASASPAEVLGWPASQLPGLPKPYERWAELLPQAKVENLVQYQPTEMRRRGASKADVEQIERVLSTFGLRLGMTAAEIAQVRGDNRVEGEYERSERRVFN